MKHHFITIEKLSNTIINYMLFIFLQFGLKNHKTM